MRMFFFFFFSLFCEVHYIILTRTDMTFYDASDASFCHVLISSFLWAYIVIFLCLYLMPKDSFSYAHRHFHDVKYIENVLSFILYFELCGALYVTYLTSLSFFEHVQM